MGRALQQSLIGAVTMKCFVVLSLALAAASAIHIPKKYEHYKPGYMRIPGWEDIASGKRKLNQKESTKVFTPRSDTVVKAACGVPGPMAEEQERIVGGVEATPHQFPWQVGLFFDGYFCCGSIISEEYILTAAHCADGVFHHEVVIGAHEIRDPNNKIIDAYSPTVHPDWDSYNLANDLSILKLDTPIDFATEPNVGPNCLASSGDYTDQMSLVSGWGRPSDSSSGISPVLRYVDDRRVMSQSECENYWGNLNEGVVCIDTSDGGVAAMVTLVAHCLFLDPAMSKSVLSPLDLPLDVKVELQLVSLKFPCTDLGSQVLLESNWNRSFYNCLFISLAKSTK